MALDRQYIEKKDFPVGRRGYDPEAVDTHLKGLADEVAELKRTARRRSDTLASSASDQVRSIVQAAESSAADIQRDAESDAKEIREEANAEAASTREQATAKAKEYVSAVSESTDTMLSRLESMQQELDTLVETLRAGGGRLSSDLKLLDGNLSEVHGVVSPPRFEAEPAAAAEPAPAPAAAAEPEPDSPAATSEAPATEEAPAHDGTTAPAQTPEAAPEAAPDTAAGGGDAEAGDDSDGARLIALNMALNGTPREETARYLEENFSLDNAGSLLNEVYASVEG